MNSDCPFCNLDREPIAETPRLYLIGSKFAVAKDGHYLIIPKRHVESCYHLDVKEWIEVQELFNKARRKLMNKFYRDSNVGFNDGELAGQTIMHAHIHIIGRRKGDVKDPRGGVRNVIPQKGNYLRKTKGKKC